MWNSSNSNVELDISLMANSRGFVFEPSNLVIKVEMLNEHV